MDETIMKYHGLSDYEKLLFERQHVKALQRINGIKTEIIATLCEELRIKRLETYVETETNLNSKDNRRVERIKILESRMEYFKNKYNRLLKSLNKK